MLGIGPLIFWLNNRNDRANQSNQGRSTLASLFNFNSSNKAIQRRISLANKVLITADNSPDKQAGVYAFAKQDVATAPTPGIHA